MKKLFFGLLMIVLATGIAGASETIDFEGGTAGMFVVQVSGSAGSGPVLVHGTNPNSALENAAMIFDSAHPTGGDADLGTPNETCADPGPGRGLGGEVGQPYENCAPLGKLLIVSEDFNPSNPDDADLVGSTLSFDFSALGSVTVEQITIVDVEPREEAPARVDLTGSNGPLGSYELPLTGNNGVGTMSLGPTAGVVAMTVTLNGSGAVDNIVFSRCGNGIREGAEICDGSDAGSCTGACNDECVCDQEPSCGDGSVDPGEQCDEGAANSDTQPGSCRTDCTRPRCGDGVVDSGEECDDGNRVDGDGCSATCEYEDEAQPEGCTPGYWKQRHHHDSWMGAAPSDFFNATFGVERRWNATRCSSSNPTLAQALGCRGGGANALARHGVAALLNSRNVGVNYGLTSDEVLYLVREALMSHDRVRIEEAKNLLAGLNENGCPLN